MRLSRAEPSLLADWWFTVDRVLLSAVLVIIAAGLLLSLAASPAVALKRGLPTFYYVERHLLFSLGSMMLFLATSLMSAAAVRRLALYIFAISITLMLLILLTSTEINGARRWLHLGGYSLQPSEFAKPAFVVLCAWLFAEAQRRPDVPATSLAVVLYLIVACLLVLEPDVGQTLLVSLIWCALFFLAGRPLHWFALLFGALAAGLAFAYMTPGYVHYRIDRFLTPGTGDTYQVDRALRSFVEGGFFGKGPGEGTIKSVLPDAHTDFIFAVVAEDYGVLACLVILGLFALVAVRVFVRQFDQTDHFARLSSSGLALIFVLQAIINMAVNVGLVPAKGITLPFISGGGSSTLAVGLSIGMLLALTRRRPDPARTRKLLSTSKPTGFETGSWQV
jgi:cell division protein FtsW